MGWGCTVAADEKLQEIYSLCNVNGNTWSIEGHRYFLEVGKELASGAVSGYVWKELPDGKRCRKEGRFYITAGGRLSKAPSVLRQLLRRGD